MTTLGLEKLRRLRYQTAKGLLVIPGSLGVRIEAGEDFIWRTTNQVFSSSYRKWTSTSCTNATADTEKMDMLRHGSECMISRAILRR
jgi:hypothetical protein